MLQMYVGLQRQIAPKATPPSTIDVEQWADHNNSYMISSVCSFVGFLWSSLLFTSARSRVIVKFKVILWFHDILTVVKWSYIKVNLLQ